MHHPHRPRASKHRSPSYNHDVSRGLILLVLLLLGCLLMSVAGTSNGLTQPLMPFTAPNPLDTDDSFSFLVYGDIQGNYRRGHDALVAGMSKEPAELVFHVGDISADSGKDYLTHFLPAVRPLAERLPFFPAIGNHDVLWGSPYSRGPFISFFAPVLAYLESMPHNAHLKMSGNQRLWFALRHRGALFIVLDSNLFIDEGQYTRTHTLEPYRNYAREQLLWVRERLIESQEDPSIRVRFVFFHHPPFMTHVNRSFLGIGGHPGHHRMVVGHGGVDNSGEPFFLLDLFRTANVTAVFCGHAHYYERWQEVIRTGEQTVRTVNWFITGMGGVKPRGRPLYRPQDVEQRLDREPAYREYLRRAAALGKGWSAELIHQFPNPAQPDGRFHNYVRVSISKAHANFETIDTNGVVRDSGMLQRFE